MNVNFFLDNNVPLKGLMIQPAFQMFLMDKGKGKEGLLFEVENESNLSIGMFENHEKVQFLTEREVLSLVLEKANIF